MIGLFAIIIRWMARRLPGGNASVGPFYFLIPAMAYCVCGRIERQSAGLSSLGWAPMRLDPIPRMEALPRSAPGRGS